jgi:DNA gyrase subunit B
VRCINSSPGNRGLKVEHSDSDNPIFELIEGEGDKAVTHAFSVQILSKVIEIGKRPEHPALQRPRRDEPEAALRDAMDPNKRKMWRVNSTKTTPSKPTACTILMGDVAEPSAVHRG